MALPVGGPLKGSSRVPFNGLGLIYGRLRTEPYKNDMGSGWDTVGSKNGCSMISAGFLVSLVWDWRTGRFQFSGVYCSTRILPEDSNTHHC